MPSKAFRDLSDEELDARIAGGTALGVVSLVVGTGAAIGAEVDGSFMAALFMVPVAFFGCFIVGPWALCSWAGAAREERTARQALGVKVRKVKPMTESEHLTEAIRSEMAEHAKRQQLIKEAFGADETDLREECLDAEFARLQERLAQVYQPVGPNQSKGDSGRPRYVRPPLPPGANPY